MWAQGPGYLGSLAKMTALKSSYMDVNPSPQGVQTWVTLDQLVQPLSPQFLHLHNGCDSTTCLIELLRGINWGQPLVSPLVSTWPTTQSHLSSPLG